MIRSIEGRGATDEFSPAFQGRGIDVNYIRVRIDDR